LVEQRGKVRRRAIQRVLRRPVPPGPRTLAAVRGMLSVVAPPAVWLVERGAVPAAHLPPAEVLEQIEESLLEQRVQLREVAVGVDDRMIDLLAHCSRAGMATRNTISLLDRPAAATGPTSSLPAGVRAVNTYVDDTSGATVNGNVDQRANGCQV